MPCAWAMPMGAVDGGAPAILRALVANDRAVWRIISTGVGRGVARIDDPTLFVVFFLGGVACTALCPGAGWRK